MCYHRSVVLIKICSYIHCAIMSPFFLHLFFFSLRKGEKSQKSCQQSIKASTYYVCYASGQMHVNIIISEAAIKIINSAL